MLSLEDTRRCSLCFGLLLFKTVSLGLQDKLLCFGAFFAYDLASATKMHV